MTIRKNKVADAKDSEYATAESVDTLGMPLSSAGSRAFSASSGPDRNFSTASGAFRMLFANPLRSLAPAEFDFSINIPQNPITLRYHDRDAEAAYRASRWPRLKRRLQIVLFIEILYCPLPVVIGVMAGYFWIAAASALFGFLLLGLRATAKRRSPAFSRYAAYIATFSGAAILAILRAGSGDRGPSYTLMTLSIAFTVFLDAILADILIYQPICTLFLVISAFATTSGLHAIIDTSSSIAMMVVAITASRARESDYRRLGRVMALISAQTKEMKATNSKLHFLLRTAFPPAVAEAMIESPNLGSEEQFVESFASVSVLVLDIVGFTARSASQPAADVVRMLSDLFARFDDVLQLHGVTKVRTIGDAVVAVAGCPIPSKTHRRDMALAALGMVHAARECSDALSLPEPLCVRIGIAVGPVTGGIVGSLRRRGYEVVGPAVTAAFALEPQARPGRILVSTEFARGLQDEFLLEAPPGSTMASGFVELLGVRNQGAPTPFRSLQQQLADLKAMGVPPDSPSYSLLRARNMPSVESIDNVDLGSDQDVDVAGEGQQSISNLLAFESVDTRWRLQFADPEVEQHFQRHRLVHGRRSSRAFILSALAFLAFSYVADLDTINAASGVPQQPMLVLRGVGAALLGIASNVTVDGIWRDRFSYETRSWICRIALLAYTQVNMARLFLMVATLDTDVAEIDAVDLVVGAEHLVAVMVLAGVPWVPYTGSWALFVGLTLEVYVGYFALFGLLTLLHLTYFVLGAVVAMYLSRTLEKVDRSGFVRRLDLGRRAEVIAEKADMSSQLMMSVLPASVLERLLKSQTSFAERAPVAVVLFVAVPDFSQLAARLGSRRTITFLGAFMGALELALGSSEMEPIKFFDGVMLAAAGLGTDREGESHAPHILGLSAVEVAMRIRELCREGFPGVEDGIAVKIGISVGEVVAGVLGKDRISYDIWGGQVNRAARLMQHAEPGAILVSRDLHELTESGLSGKVEATPRELNMKGFGEVVVFQLDDRAG